MRTLSRLRLQKIVDIFVELFSFLAPGQVLTEGMSAVSSLRSVCFQLPGRRVVTILQPLIFGNYLRAEQ